MAGGFDIRGTSALIKKATAFRNYDPVLRRALGREMTKALAPIKAELRKSARDTLPRAGGLNELVAKSTISTRTVLSGKTGGIRVVMSSPHDIDGMNRGRLRHPVFGNRGVWRTQEVKPGWWDEAADKVKPAAALAARKVLDDIAKGVHG